MKIRIGTRGSRLARIQTESVARALEARGHTPEVVEIRTAGDRHADRPFSRIGAPGVFVREIETALLEGRIEVAVHSYKDLPGVGPEDLGVAAVPERLDPSDRLVARPESAHASVLADHRKLLKDWEGSLDAAPQRPAKKV